MLRLELDTALASDMSRVEDAVRATVRQTVVVDGMTAIPDGSVVHGTVTSAEPSGKVKGRARLSFRFDRIDIEHDRYEVRSEIVFYEAKSTRREDAKKIGIGAGAGAVIGGLLGGGAGTAMVLTTAGQEVELRPGTTVEVALARALAVLVPNH